MKKGFVACVATLVACAFTVNLQAQDSWETVATSELRRAESATVVYDGRLYSFAGFKEGLKIVDATDAYDPATDAWTPYRPMPRAVTHVGAALVGNSMWFVGGFEGDHPGRALDVAQIYNFDENLWYAGPPLPERRASGALVLLGRRLHYIGGLLPNRQTDSAEHYVLDLDNQYSGWYKAAPLPSGRNHLSAIVYGGRIYAIGGQFGHDVSRDVVKLVHAYDPVSDSWTRMADIPSVRSHFEFSTFTYGRMIYIVGGIGRDTPSGPAVDYISRYDPASNQWAEVDRLPLRLIGPGARMIETDLFVMFGGENFTGNATGTVFRKDMGSAQPDTLGFWPAHQTGRVRTGTAEIAKTLLWTIETTASYSLEVTSGSSWLSLVSPSAGETGPTGSEVSVRIDATHLDPGQYVGSIRASASGFASVDVNFEIEVEARPTDAFVETDGLIVLEAEDYHGRHACTTHDWTATDLYGSFGSAMEALPNRGTRIDGEYELLSPELRYVLSVTTPGTYYVWVRGWGQDGDADSWYIGLDAIGAETADRMTLRERQTWPPLWTWSNWTMDQERATLHIKEPGVHVLSLWMREDGLLVDRIALSTDPQFVPAGTGPPASPKVALSDGDTSTAADRADVPASFSLEPNYPNPFNPETTIRYSLAKSSSVTLSVYDLLGHLVARLVDDQNQTAGLHEVSFDASHLPSGVYAYRLQADSFTSIRQMTLVK